MSEIFDYIKKLDNGLYYFDEEEYLSSLPDGLQYYAVDEKNEKIYGLGKDYNRRVTQTIRKATIEKVFDVINKEYNWLGWIEDVEFDEFKENVLAELAKELKKDG